MLHQPANAGGLKIDSAGLTNEALRLTTLFAFVVFTIFCFVLEIFDNITSGEALFLTLLATFFDFVLMIALKSPKECCS